jgi:hypothetical protein
MIPGYKLKSNVCVSPGLCYPVDTELPAWILLVLIGASVFTLKEIYNLINS